VASHVAVLVGAGWALLAFAFLAFAPTWLAEPKRFRE
jgi:hypothetical protein